MSKFSVKMHTSHMLGTFVLLAMTANLAIAITAFTPQAQPTGYVAQIEISNYNLASGTETIFRPEYEKEFWSGNLYAYPVDAAGNLDIAAERWSGGAKSKIDAQDYLSGRKIATMRDDGTEIAFLATNLSATQQAYFAATIQGVPYTSAQIVNFLRGDRSNEAASKLRVRSSVLGGIMHSRPYYVADASNPTVFVGANDGMLHAINATLADGGKERWAYIPSMLLNKMKNLAANPYVHDYYVDGQINIADVNIGTLNKRVLVGGLGAGGKGFYALDITTLTAATEADVADKILWEITPSAVSYTASSAYANLGYTYGAPLITKVRNGFSPKDAVIIGNGYNDNATGDYAAYLYVIDVANGQLTRAIKAGASGTAASPNGLSSPFAVDTDSNGVVDIVFAGDLNGTLWKFDITSTSPASWSATALYTTSPAQPITTTLGVAVHPNGGYMVNFGTGKMFAYTFPSPTRASTTAPVPTGTDPDRSTVYSVYGIWDRAPVGNATLLTQTLTERSYTNAGITTRVRRSTDTAPNWSSGGHKGWKVALPAGERVVGEGSFTENGRFYFNSYNPNVGYAIPNTTTNVYGENWLMELNYLTGGSSTLPFLDMDNNLVLNNGDRIKYLATDPPPTGKTTSDFIPGAAGIPVGKWISIGVQSQPILVQLKILNSTLFNQNPDVTFTGLPPAAAVVGVAGGHFDEDIYYGTSCTTKGCTSTVHIHQYDDKYDRTGVNMLNASNTSLNLANAIPSTATMFKVLAQNQYLNPAVKIHIGDASYVFNVDNGYIAIKNFVTSATLDVATLPTYNRNTIGSLAINMPVDVFTPKDWWGGAVADVRAGLHPTQTGCVKKSAGTDGNLYQPVIPPDNGANGPGANSLTTGARHNGALVIQIIKDTTPNSALEQNVAGRPEYGWRVKKADFATHVLAEYTTFWHHGPCYGSTGWTKTPGVDAGASGLITPAAGSTDPKVGAFGASTSACTSIVSITTVSGSTTTTTVSCNTGGTLTLIYKIDKTPLGDGKVTIVTTYADGTVTTETVADKSGASTSGGDERGLQSRTGRVSWHELIRD